MVRDIVGLEIGNHKHAYDEHVRGRRYVVIKHGMETAVVMMSRIQMKMMMKMEKVELD